MSEENGTTFDEKITSLGDSIVALTLAEAVSLGTYLEEEHGIKPAAAGVAVAAGPTDAGEGDVDVEPTDFNVVLEGLADTSKKIAVIKVVREITGAGLKDAKDMVEGAPKDLKENLPKEEAEGLKKKLEEAGAKVTLKPA